MEMDSIQYTAKIISNAGLKVTPQRVAVMQALNKLHHPTAEEIHKEVLQKIPGLSPTTVYNILDAFVKLKIISKVQSSADAMRYDAIQIRHHHLYSTQGTRIVDYFDPELDKILCDYFNNKKIDDFRISDLRLQIMGEFYPQKES